MAFELRSPLCDKGSALNWVVDHLCPPREEGQRAETLLVAIGDDATDEDLFAAADEAVALGKVASAFTVKVLGETASEGPSMTRAQNFLASTDAVALLLRQILAALSTAPGAGDGGVGDVVTPPLADRDKDL